MKFGIASSLLAVVVALTGLEGSSADSILDVVVNSEFHNTLQAAVLAAPPSVADLLAGPGSYTLFAPDDTAFGNLIGAVGEDYVTDLLSAPWYGHLVCVLTSHVLASEVFAAAIPSGTTPIETLSGYEITIVNDAAGITIDGNAVTGADIDADNGVVHVISALPILPPCVTTDIYTAGSATDALSTLISLVDAVGLQDYLKTERPLTVFAPTNEAFECLPEEVLTYLGGNATALTEVLTYHVINGAMAYSADVFDELSVPTVQGTNVTLDVKEPKSSKSSDEHEGPRIKVEYAKVVAVDILASNGVVHVIDRVLVPEDMYFPFKVKVKKLKKCTKPSKDSTEGAMSTSMDDETRIRHNRHLRA